jgi:ariadne-1
MQDSDLEDCDFFDEEELKELQPKQSFHSPTIPSTPAKSSPITLTLDQVWVQFVLSKSQALCSTLSFLAPDEAITALQLCNWNYDDTITKLLGENAFFSSFTRCTGESDSSSCFVCGNDATNSLDTPLYSYSCSHCICLDCLCGWSKAKMEEYHSSPCGIACPAIGCKCTLALPFELFEAVPSVKAATVRSLVECGSFSLRACNKCTGYIWAPDLAVNYQVVQCTQCLNNNETQCFGCGYIKGHMPLPCAQFEEWEHETPEEAQNAEWIYYNAKACPNCNIVIQRDQGCNHMKCQMCKYEFCWICLQIWVKHDNYSCHVYQNPKDQARNAGDNHAFFFFHWNRYVNHQKAIETQNTTLRDRLMKLQNNNDVNHADRGKNVKKSANSNYNQEKVNDDFGDCSNSTSFAANSTQSNAGAISWIGMEFLFQALDELLETRRVLQYNYVFMFFLKQNHHSQVYGDCVQDLADAVEKLSGLLEDPAMRTAQQVHKVMPEVKHWTAYLKMRRKALLDETIKELQSGTWSFTSFAERKKFTEKKKVQVKSKLIK